jgi:hypothetical protein
MAKIIWKAILLPDAQQALIALTTNHDSTQRKAARLQALWAQI